MGNNQSSVRAAHFQRPTQEPDDTLDDSPEEHHISISNKMVERLVEDAAVAGSAAVALTPTIPRGDYKDKIYMERLKCLDDSHSERAGLTLEDMNALVARIDYRTANMVDLEPVCADIKDRVIECYNNYDTPEDNFKCWDAVGAFTQCVQEAATQRLKARTQREARDHARRSRHVALAREHELKDLSVPREQSAAS